MPDSNVVRMWSIGQWVQVNPDPDREDIYDWYDDSSMFPFVGLVIKHDRNVNNNPAVTI